MPVVVDHQPLSTGQLGLSTFGQVMSHLQKENRLIVHVLIDGEEPDLGKISALRQTSTDQHTIFVETTEPQTMAREVLDAVESSVGEADAMATEAGNLLQAGEPGKAFEKLSGCFARWQHTQESILKIGQLLRIDLERIDADDEPFLTFLNRFAVQLREIRDALENRDFVALADALKYEMAGSTQKWRAAVAAMRDVVG